MKKIITVLILLLISAGIFFIIKFGIFTILPQKGILSIESQPASSLFINGETKGQTPFEDKVKEGDYTIKLVSDSTPESPSWEQTIPVIPNAESFVRVYFGSSASDNSWEKIYFTPVEKNNIQLTVLSDPDSAEVYIEDILAGTTPLSLNEISEGKHTLRLKLKDYAEKDLTVQTKKGFLLNVETKLRSLQPDSIHSTESATNKQSNNSIEIVSPDTGWLRVRSEATKSSEELGKVNNGEKFTNLEEQDGWIKIEYESGKFGWISGEYTKKVEEPKTN